MASPLSILDFDFIVALGVGMARLYPCLLLTPLFSFEYIRGLPRHAIVVALALVPAPGIREFVVIQDLSALGVLGLAVKELMLGCVIGILLAMPFWMFESVGALLDNQRGALMGGQINPNFGPSDTPTGRLFRDMAVYLLIVVVGFTGLLQLVWDSYRLWPPTVWFPRFTSDGFDIFLGVLDETLRHMILYSAPFVIILLMVDFAMGVMNLFSPQLNVFLLSIPAKSVIGFAFLLIYFPTLVDLMSASVGGLLDLPALLELIIQRPS